MSLRKKFALGGAMAVVAAITAATPQSAAQYPGQIKKGQKSKDFQPMRSVVVVEWTGDLAKPKASRVIPISVWDGNDLQDGGIYLARPQPLALDYGVEYELQQNGKGVGLFEIQEAARQQYSWIGFGRYRALPAKPSPEELARMSANVKIDAGDDYSDQPVLHRKHHDDDPDNSGSASGEKGAPPDPDRPTLHSGSSSGDAQANAPNGGGPAPDPDRPRLHQDTASTSGGGQSSDPDRPRLHDSPPANQEAHVNNPPDVADPDRPKLKRGIPEGGGPAMSPTAVAPNVMGVPVEMKQEVGVSDNLETKEHTWEFTWADPDDQRKMKETVEEEALKALGLAAPPPPAPATKRSSTTTAARRSAAPPPLPPELPKLIDEQFRVYELAYGGGVTMVFSAHTDGEGVGQKYVTLIAQPDLYGSVVLILKNVTDAAHLDIKPRMRLIDAVDAEGDNRGELLFELRGQNQRQFALYRVLRGQASQIFETAITFFGSAGE